MALIYSYSRPIYFLNDKNIMDLNQFSVDYNLMIGTRLLTALKQGQVQ